MEISQAARRILLRHALLSRLTRRETEGLRMLSLGAMTMGND